MPEKIFQINWKQIGLKQLSNNMKMRLYMLRKKWIVGCFDDEKAIEFPGSQEHTLF
jgi:hypothetical protein